MQRQKRGRAGGLSRRMALRAYLGGGMALRTGMLARHPIPHEPGEWIETRELGWKDLKVAQQARQAEGFSNLREMGKELYQMIQEVQADIADPPRPDAAPADPLASHDLETLLRLGIAGWSYDAPVNAETLGQLDPATAEWAGRVIVGAHGDPEADRKNG